MRFFLLLALATILSAPAQARTGHDQGNGGDLYAAEFVEAGQRLLDLLKFNDTKGIDLNALELAIKRTKVESTDEELRLGGLPKDAINYPAQNRIVFNRKRWLELDSGQKPVLVLHEYLGLLGVEDANYLFSKRLLGAFKYDISYALYCDLKNGKGDLNIGIDESAGLDTILMSINWADGSSDIGDVMRPVGEFSRMIRDGAFSLSLNDQYLLSLRQNGKALELDGHLAAKGKVFELTCKITKLDLSLLETYSETHPE